MPRSIRGMNDGLVIAEGIGAGPLPAGVLWYVAVVALAVQQKARLSLFNCRERRPAGRRRPVGSLRFVEQAAFAKFRAILRIVFGRRNECLGVAYFFASNSAFPLAAQTGTWDCFVQLKVRPASI